jgi:RNA polymerase sigma-70 factor, ECF subfamily
MSGNPANLLLMPGRLMDVPGLLMSSPEPVTKPLDESVWLAQAQAGDRAAFAKVVDLYWDRLYRWLYQLTRDPHKAEDLTQETFLKVLAAIGSFHLGTNFRAWLFRIGHNNFVNLKRAERKNQQTLPDEPPSRDLTGPDDKAADREMMAKVAKAVSELPTEFRTALLLRIDEDLSFRDVAGILNITEETARWRVFKARQKLMKTLGEELFGEVPVETKK